jgi:hypothetical protein
MVFSRAAECACCGKAGKRRQIDELLHFNRDEPAIVLCNNCLRSLRYADAGAWKWFREYRSRNWKSISQ